MRSRIVIGIVMVLMLGSIPLPGVSSAPSELNTSVATSFVQDAVREDVEELRLIVWMNRDFTQADVDFLKEHDAVYYGHLRTLPVAFVGLDAESTIALSWYDGVKQLDLDRPLQYFMETAVVSTQAASVWGNESTAYLTEANPITIDGNVIDGSGVSVAVVDSGVDATHPDLPLETKVVQNKQYACSTPFLVSTYEGRYRCGGDGVIDQILEEDAGQEGMDNDPYVDLPNTDLTSGHGTHVAGTVAGLGTMSNGRHVGAAPDASIVSLGHGGVIFILSALTAWDYINANYDEITPRVKVITNSWGDCAATYNGGDTVARKLIDQLVAKGVVFTFAAGNVDSTCRVANDGTIDATSSYCDIASYVPGVLCVANGMDANSGKREDMRLAGSSSVGAKSNPNTWPDITAPGTDITAPWARTGIATGPGDTLWYTTISGTSMATPHVAGIIALLYEANPDLTPAQVEQILEGTAVKFGDAASYNAEGTSHNKGHGLVNALDAVNEAIALRGLAPQSGSSLYGAGGIFYIYQSVGLVGIDPFIGLKDKETMPQGGNASLNLRGAGVAAFTGETTIGPGDAEFRLVDEDGNVLDVIPVDWIRSDTAFGGYRLSANWTANVPAGQHTLQAWIHGLNAKETGLRIVGQEDVVPSCVSAETSLAFTSSGVSLVGRITKAPGPVDMVRVTSVRGDDVLGWALTSRTDENGLVEFEVPLTSDMVVPGATLGINTFSNTVPCFATVHVPESTPENLESTQPAGVFQPGNPWLNPGFEFASPVEWDSALSPDWRAQARSVAPPTYLRAYDGESGTPHSTHEVAYGNGTSGNALLVHYNASDDGRNLILGQFFGPPETGPWVWLGADTIEFEYNTTTALDDFQVTVHYVPEGGNQTGLGGSVDVVSDGTWQRAVVDVSAIPDNATLTGAVIRISGADAGDVAFDNVRVTGSTFSLVDLHSDLTDGYSMLVLPETANETVSAVDALEVAPLVTGKGEAFVAQTKLRDFTGITPAWVDARDAKYAIFGIAGKSYVENGWSTKGLERDVKGAVKVDGSAVAFAVDKTATLAQTDNGLGVAYAYWNISQVREANDRLVYSGEGYYSAFKNSVQNYTLADQLDGAVTPVRLLDEDATSEVTGLGNASVVITVPTNSDGFSVRIDVPKTGWIEETTLSVTGYPDRTIVLDGSGDSLFENYEGDGTGLRADLAGTIFVRGDSFVTGNPVPKFFVCKAPDHAQANGCRAREAQSAKSLEEMHFDASESEDPNAEGLQYQWDFGDGTGAEGAQVSHVFTTPGDYEVTLAVTDTTGATETASTTVTVLNRAPNVTATLPERVTRTGDLTVPVNGVDADGTVETLSVALDGTTLATADAASTEVTIPKADLTLGTHTLTLTAWDDLGASTIETLQFTVENLDPTADLTASSTLVGQGSAVTFTPSGEDADSATVTLALAFGDGSTAENLTAGDAVTHTFATAGTFPVTLTATDADGGVASTTLDIVVDGAAPVTTASVEDGAWHTGNVSIELAAVDDHASTTTYYQVDGGNLTTYEGAFEVGGDGTHTVTFHSVDAFGHAETPQTVTVKIDSGLPVIDMDGMPKDFEVVAGEQQLVASASDDVSGIASVRILIDGEACGAGVSTAECTWDTSGTTLGFFELTVEATDVAGHVATQSVAVLVMNGMVMPLGASLPAFL